MLQEKKEATDRWSGCISISCLLYGFIENLK